MRHKKNTIALLTAVLVLAGASTTTADAFAAPPRLKVYTTAAEEAPPGAKLVLATTVENVGRATVAGPITFTETLSPGFTPPEPGIGAGEQMGSISSGTPFPTTCETVGMTITCTTPDPMPPGVLLHLFVNTTVEATASGVLTGDVAVSSGGASVRAQHSTTISILPGPFAFTAGAVELFDADGSQAGQAASDPASFTTTLGWRSFASKVGANITAITGVAHFKDVTAHLPPGLIGNPSVALTCTLQGLASEECPPESQVGVARVYLTAGTATEPRPNPLYNMVAPYGVATQLGFSIYETSVLLQAHVRPGDHGVDIVSRDTSTSAPITRVEVEVWGVPAEPRYDPYRNLCLTGTAHYGANGSLCPSSAPRKAFLRLPTGCAGEPLHFGADSNTYEHPGEYASISFDGPTLGGCDAVPFSPSIRITPTNSAASSPSGVDVKLSMPQSNTPDGLQEADLKKAVVALPEGMVINPSAADGLQACTDAELNLDSNTPAQCPNASKIGTVVLHTQLIPNPIEGSVYLRTQNSDDPMSGEMFRIAIELRDDSHGLDFKIPGQIQADPSTGRLTTTFDNNPQFPFEDIALKFKAGARAPLVTPSTCTPGPMQAALSPYSTPNNPVLLQSSFVLSSGPEGEPCGVQGFAPGFQAGVESVQAGGYTPFLATFSRRDSDQSMHQISVKMPPGLLGSLVGLPLCAEAQANAGTCSAASEIGTVTVASGAGPNPFYVTGAKIFLTGPYEGAPFGLSAVVPAKAGPFDLGNVVVRSRIEVDPHTAQLTASTDPLPQIVKGVPVNIRLVNVTINRPDFTYNPTNCDPMSVTGTMTAPDGTTAPVGNHFQVTNCGALKFQPHFMVSTPGKASRANGIALDAKLTYPKTPQGTEANIAKVKVALPKQLPSRLSTLQKACLAETFEANPAACPAPSRVGMASATTPVLPVPLNGPVYFVSHGGEAFPDLVIVLQGYGVTVDLIGTTFISKTGITSTTFKTVPDVPVGAFQLKLPQGPYSALTANGNLCKSKLAMPTTLIAQNGAEIHQNTKIAVTSCPKHKYHTARSNRHRKKK